MIEDRPERAILAWTVPKKGTAGGRAKVTGAIEPAAVPEEDETMTYRDVARFLKITEESVRKAVQRKKVLPPVRIGRRCLWLKSAFLSWFREQHAAAVQRDQTGKMKGGSDGDL